MGSTTNLNWSAGFLNHQQQWGEITIPMTFWAHFTTFPSSWSTHASTQLVFPVKLSKTNFRIPVTCSRSLAHYTLSGCQFTLAMVFIFGPFLLFLERSGAFDRHGNGPCSSAVIWRDVQGSIYNHHGKVRAENNSHMKVFSSLLICMGSDLPSPAQSYLFSLGLPTMSYCGRTAQTNKPVL